MDNSNKMLNISTNNEILSNQVQNKHIPIQVSYIDAHVVSVLKSILGQRIVVETVRGSLSGKLMDVQPDHIVLGEKYESSSFFIRIAEIVYIMPIVNDCDCSQ